MAGSGPRWWQVRGNVAVERISVGIDDLRVKDGLRVVVAADHKRHP